MGVSSTDTLRADVRLMDAGRSGDGVCLACSIVKLTVVEVRSGIC